MHVISIDGSEHQKSRLRNGHKVRVKHGTGFNLIVSPNTYHLVSRAFNKNKGTTMQLSPEEIDMNRAPSPEIQRQIMGHNNHLILPNTTGQLIKGSGIGDFFKNLGNTIKSGVENTIINPVKKNIVDPAMNLYNQNVPADIRRDINTGMRFASTPGLAIDVIKRLKNGEKIQDIGRNYIDDLKHLNNTKNKIIKSSPALTEAYKKGVPALAGLATGAIGTTLGLNPLTGALLGAAGAKGADELLKAEGYGLVHAINHGIKHHYHELKHHLKPIGGSLGRGRVSDFFKYAGNKLKSGYRGVKKGAEYAHNIVKANPALASKIKEHGSKLAGMLAKMGINYLTGSEDYGDIAENLGSKFAHEQLDKNLTQDTARKPAKTKSPTVTTTNTPSYSGIPMEGSGLYSGIQGNGLGTGLYAGRMRGTGPFHSFNTLKDASDAYSNANAELANMTKLIIHNQHTQRPIQKYYESDNAPPSRGTGIHPHTAHHIHQNNHLHHREHTRNPHDTNLIRGRGTLMEHETQLPPALVSQPYGSNFHMQFQLPPQYQKYNDGTHTF